MKPHNQIATHTQSKPSNDTPTPKSPTIPQAPTSNISISTKSKPQSWFVNSKDDSMDLKNKNESEISHNNLITLESRGDFQRKRKDEEIKADERNKDDRSRRGEGLKEERKVEERRENKRIENRRGWREVDSQDSGVQADSDVLPSDHSILMARPQAPPIQPFALPFANKDTLLGGQNKVPVLRRKDTLPNIDNIGMDGKEQSRRRHWVAKETDKVSLDPKPLIEQPKDKGIWKYGQPYDNAMTQQPSNKRLRQAIDKADVTNFYLGRSRYSPMRTPSNNKLGFGSSAPRFREDPTPSPPIRRGWRGEDLRGGLVPVIGHPVRGRESGFSQWGGGTGIFYVYY